MAAFNLTKLVNRKLIKISGPDCYPYLQSLFTNDLRYLYEPDRIPKRKHAIATSNVLGTFMLNAQGRVICDILLYRTPHTRYECKFSQPGEAKEPDELLIECDANIATGLANTLYAYRVRRKVALEIITNLDVWCLYPRLNINNKQQITGNDVEANEVQSFNLVTIANEILDNNITIVNDPRLDLMGLRILSNSSYDYNNIKNEIRSKFNFDNLNESAIGKYILHKYRMGIGEGSEDHPEGSCLPLECNADLLGSVSFDKGCYLGQELTARIHYTGVVRKRLMPIMLSTDNTKAPPTMPFLSGSDIIDATNGKKLGVLRSVHRGGGLALLRHDQITESSKPIHEATQVPITTWRPYWWSNVNS
uniref:Putative transferase CAF17, mitochondrial n=1 Tax=Aceria tosichella TaxID=561515 RepID=A0A6G1SN75_9ACAR